MKYDEMSDFEINKKLALLVGHEDVRAHRNSTVTKCLSRCVSFKGGTADYCNNWSDIGPLIEKYKIKMEPRSSMLKLGWLALKNGHDCRSENPKRAAAICIIKLLKDDQ